MLACCCSLAAVTDGFLLPISNGTLVIYIHLTLLVCFSPVLYIRDRVSLLSESFRLAAADQ